MSGPVVDYLLRVMRALRDEADRRLWSDACALARRCGMAPSDAAVLVDRLGSVDTADAIVTLARQINVDPMVLADGICRPKEDLRREVRA